MSSLESVMIREYGNMFDVFNTTDNFIVTTNSYLRSDNALVMGRGAAKQLANRVPMIPHGFGRHIKQICGDLGTYSVLILPYRTGSKHYMGLGAFQVKYHYNEDACIKLIAHATNQLKHLAEIGNDERYDMNYPGIGNGRLSMDDVAPIIETLPDNVHVWTFR